ncbi:MAG: leucine-rich repeat domain-containing protein [Bacteroidales bacterium]|nr:leucine-rich repeat domain-containing protein [Bacteroidales bacterium]
MKIFIITIMICISTHLLSAQIVVNFNDPNLEQVVRDSLNIPTDDILDTDMLSLSMLYADGLEISDITGLEYALNLKFLSLHYNQINNISLLAGLTKLEHLNLSYNQIENINAVSDLINLIRLSADGNQISNIDALTNLSNLRDLNIMDNQIEDIDVLSNFTDLEILSLSNNQIKNIDALSGLLHLRSLFLSFNNINNINSLSGLISISQLYINNNHIQDISVLSNLTEIFNLYLHSNEIEDIDALSNLTKITHLTLHHNQLNDNDLPNLYPLDYLYNQWVDTEGYGGGYLDLRWNLGFTEQAIRILADSLDQLDYEHILWDEGSDVTIKEAEKIKDFKLFNNYPNPFNPFTNIKFTLPKSEMVTLKIFNLMGQEKETLINEYLTVGMHQVKWSARELPSGIYFYKLQAGEISETKKLIFQK